jgi:hypothetical protein
MERINLCETCKNKFRQKIYRYAHRRYKRKEIPLKRASLFVSNSSYYNEPHKSEDEQTVLGWKDLKDRDLV